MKNERIHILREAITVIAQMLSGRGIKVTQRGTSAYVTPDSTGKPVSINLPYIPDGAKPDLCDAIQGFLDHEVAHILFTDFKAFGAIGKNEKLHSLANIIEDPRIEKAMTEEYRGCGTNLRNTGEFFLKKFTIPEMQKADSSGDPSAMMAVLTVPLIRALSGQELFKDFMNGKMHHVADFYELIKDLAPRLEANNSTAESIAIATEIRKRLGDEEEEGEGEEEGKGSGKSKPMPGKGKGGAGKGKSSPSPAAPGEEEEGEEEGEGGGASGEEEEEGEEGKAPGEEEKWEGEEDTENEESANVKAINSALDKQHKNDFSDQMSRMITSDTILAAKNSEYLVFTKEDDVIETLVVGSDYNPSMFTKLADEVDHMVAPLQKDLERAIVARSAAVHTGGHRSGKLHGASLARLATGDERVFRRKQENTTKDVAVELVIDISGSMSGKKIHTATQAAYALSSVLDRLKITHEVVCFTTGPETRDPKMREEESRLGRRFTRTESLYMPIVKGFNERMSTDVKQRFGWLPNNRLMRNNIDGECVEVALRRLMSRKEAGKTMIVLSDGHPACAGDSGRVSQHLKEVVKGAEAAGVNVIGIGIQDEAVKRFYSKHVVIQDVSELPTTVMLQLRKLLIPQ